MGTAFSGSPISIATQSQRGVTSGADMMGFLFGSGDPAQNYLINGGFDFWNRGTLFQPNAYAYSADRWNGYIPTSSRHTQVDVSSLNIGFKWALRIQRDSGSTNTSGHNIEQPLETETLRSLWGKQVTWSFWARAGANFSGAASSLTVNVFFGTGTERARNFTAFTGEVSPISTSQVINTTMQRYSFTFTVPYGVTQGCVFLYYVPSGTAGASDYFDFTGSVLNIGSVAQPFSRAGKTIGGELTLCERYGERIPFVIRTDSTSGVGGTTRYFRYRTKKRTSNLLIKVLGGTWHNTTTGSKVSIDQDEAGGVDDLLTAPTTTNTTGVLPTAPSSGTTEMNADGVSIGAFHTAAGTTRFAGDLFVDAEL